MQEPPPAFPSGSVRLDEGGLLVDLLVGNAGRAPLVLAALRGGTGMGVALHTVQGRPATLPLEVPSGVGSGQLPALAVTVRLRVEDCSAVVPPDPGSEVFDQSSAATLVTSFAASGAEPDPAFEGFTPRSSPRRWSTCSRCPAAEDVPSARRRSRRSAPVRAGPARSARWARATSPSPARWTFRCRGRDPMTRAWTTRR